MPRNEKKERPLLASAARVATTTLDFDVPQGVGLILIVDVTARAGSTTLTPKLSAMYTGQTFTLDVWTATAAINSADTTVAYAFYPGATADSAADYTEEVSLAMPKRVRLTMTHSDTDSITYSVWAVELP